MRPKPEIDRYSRVNPLAAVAPYRLIAGLCGLCGEKLTGQRTEWCSDEHADEAMVMAGMTTYVRNAVLGRDRGVCALCARPGLQIESGWENGEIDTSALVGWGFDPPTCSWCGLPERPVCSGGANHGRPHVLIMTFWHADHVVPVVQGGGGCGADGYRTLCVPCHKRETAELAARRAADRKRQRFADLQPAGQLALW